MKYEIKDSIAVPMFSTAASALSPQISVQVSLVVVVPPVQVHPDSIAHEQFSMKTIWIFQYPTWKTVKGFPGRPIGIPSEVRRAPDDVTWSEICGDGKRFNSVSIYCDDGNVANEDGYQKRCEYSKNMRFVKMFYANLKECI